MTDSFKFLYSWLLVVGYWLLVGLRDIISIFLCKPFFEYLTILIILLGKWHVASTYEEMPFGIRNAVIEGLCH